MTDIERIVIVGAGLTGAKAVETLRQDGYDGRIVLLGDEPHLPYVRPPLSKDYLRGESKLESALVHAQAWYGDHRIDVGLSSAVRAIEPRARHVVLADDRRISFDRLLIATGAAPRRIRIPGAELAGIHYLRTVNDADAIRTAAARAQRAIVIGGGWIGSEVAASLRQLGLPVAMIADTRVPLERVLGPEVGAVYRDIHEEHGVTLVMNERVTEFTGGTAVEAVVTSSGSRIAGDLVVVGVGAEPRTQLAADAGLDLDAGVAVNEYLETSVEGIYAAGDVAAAWHPVLGTRLRVEHWDNARRQGKAAARNMLGHAEPYERIPYFYSDQFDLGMEYVGFAPSWDRVVFRGDPATRTFIAFWLRDGRVVAGMNANVWEVGDAIGALISSREQVAVDRLADPAIPLDDLDALVMPTAALVG